MNPSFQNYIEILIQEKNNRPVADFEGLSSRQLHTLLHCPFGNDSVIKLNKLEDSEYTLFPLFNMAKFLLELIAKQGQLKLTEKGFLPIKVVAEIYNQKFLTDEYIESGLMKLYKESDSVTINLCKNLLQIAGLTKKRTNKLSITKTGEKLLKSNADLFEAIFDAYVFKFNWCFYDGYGDNDIAQIGFGFSLYLLLKFGNEKQIDTFYAMKYFTALPFLKGELITDSHWTLEDYISKCYSLRTFERILSYLGLVSIETEQKYLSPNYIVKTEMFEKLFTLIPEKSFTIDNLHLN